MSCKFAGTKNRNLMFGNRIMLHRKRWFCIVWQQYYAASEDFLTITCDDQRFFDDKDILTITRDDQRFSDDNSWRSKIFWPWKMKTFFQEKHFSSFLFSSRENLMKTKRKSLAHDIFLFRKLFLVQKSYSWVSLVNSLRVSRNSSLHKIITEICRLPGRQSKNRRWLRISKCNWA